MKILFTVTLVIYAVFTALPQKSFYKEILPVELVYFNAYLIDSNYVLLKWGTATEVSNFGFEVERSDSIGNWNTLGFIQGNGNSNSPKNYSFNDSTVVYNHSYSYRLKQWDTDGSFKFSDTVDINIVTNITNNTPITNSFTLSQNYPNPFNPSTIITYSVPTEEKIKLFLYDCTGRIVRILVNENKLPGNYFFNFDAKNLSSGVYFYCLQAGEGRIIKKMLLLK